MAVEQVEHLRLQRRALPIADRVRPKRIVDLFEARVRRRAAWPVGQASGVFPRRIGPSPAMLSKVSGAPMDIIAT